VVLPRFLGVVRRVERVAVGDVGMVPSLVMILVLVVGRSFTMMLGRQFVMLGRLAMMIRALVIGHVFLPARGARHVSW
jgi:hypothetical protein